MAGRGGFEPPLTDPESVVLPLDDLPKHPQLYTKALSMSNARRIRSALPPPSLKQLFHLLFSKKQQN